MPRTGRPPKNGKPMTRAESNRRYNEKLRKSLPQLRRLIDEVLNAETLNDAKIAAATALVRED